MKFRIRRASCFQNDRLDIPGSYKDGEHLFIDIFSIEELLALENQRQLKNYDFEPPYSLLIYRDWENKEWAITIADDYLE